MRLPEDPQDIMSELRKRFGSVAAFERANELPAKSVNDLMRGRRSARVVAAIQEALSKPVSSFRDSEVSDSSASAEAHRLSSAAR